MKYTPNLNLSKPNRGDYRWNIALNGNADAIDQAIGGLNSSIDDLPDIERHAGIFGGSAGVSIQLTKSVDAINEYGVEIVPTSRAAAIGDIWVVKATDSFSVHCSEANSSDTFEAIVYFKGDVTSYGGSIYRRYYISPSTSITDHSDASAIGSLAYILGLMSGAGGILEFPANRTYPIVANDITIPAGVRLYPHPGAIIDVASGRTLTIAGTISCDDRRQIFSGDGAISKSGWCPAIFPEWFDSYDTPAMRKAIAFLDSSFGGVIDLAGRTYTLYPQSAGIKDHALTIDKSNIAFLGKGNTKLDFYALNGDDPETNFEIIDSAVWRGSAFYITGGADSAGARKNIIFSNLEIDGNCSYTGDATYPANTSTGDGWDITHKAIHLEADKYHQGISIFNCKIHGFKGELLYGGGIYIEDITIRDSKIYETNGDCYSISGGARISNNEMHTAAASAMEVSYTRSKVIVQNNYLHDCDLNIASFTHDNGGEVYGPVIFKGNILANCQKFGFWTKNPKNLSILNNLIIDCGQLTNYEAIEVWNDTDRLDNVHILDNLMVYKNANCFHGLSLNSYVSPASGVICERNRVVFTKYAVDAGKTIVSGFNISGDFGSDCIINDNQELIHGAANDMEVTEKLISTTSAENILTYLPGFPGWYAVDIHYRIITAATNILVVATYYDPSDTPAGEVLVNETAQAVGNYNVRTFTMLSNGTNNIEIAFTVGTANQVYASAKIRKL